jgi:hypothetical protein
MNICGCYLVKNISAVYEAFRVALLRFSPVYCYAKNRQVAEMIAIAIVDDDLTILRNCRKELRII